MGPTSWEPLPPEELGRLLPEYEVFSLLGRGGMGAVYSALERSLDRPVAIKVLPIELGTTPGFSDRFCREARALAKLNHPHVVRLHRFGRTQAGHLYFTMDLVEGTTLESLISGTGMNLERVLKLAGEICSALACAHEQGVVHRDMKPSNVLVDTAGKALVMDFGVARLLDPTLVEPGHTVTGLVLGTPEYMAPDQKRGQSVDHRADLYSLGVMLYEMLCRKTPQGAFAPPSKICGCPVALDRIVAKAMQPEPGARYSSATEMQRDLDAVADLLSGRGWTRLIPNGRLSALLTVVFLAAVIGAYYRHLRDANTTQENSTPTTAESGWRDALAAVRTGEIPIYRGQISSPYSVEPEFGSTNLVWSAEAGLRARGSFFLLLPASGAMARDQALRISFRGRQWAFDVRRTLGTRENPGQSYGLQMEEAFPRINLGIATHGVGFLPFMTFPWPAGFDWDAVHDLELEAKGNRITVTLDGALLVNVRDDRLAEGGMAIWVGDRGEIRRLEYRISETSPSPDRNSR
jgi:serine/threonine protein kinase